MIARLVAFVALVLLLGASFFVGRRTVNEARPVVPELRTETTFVAVAGHVGSVRRVVVEFPRTATGLNAAILPGTVTGLVGRSEAGRISLDAAGELGTVDQVPVAVVLGEVPAFRDLKRDDRGDDVRQLQVWLQELGFLDAAAEADGVFGRVTANAVRSWEAATGQTQDGVVPLGQLIFVPRFPVEMPADRLVVGGPSPSLIDIEIPDPTVLALFRARGFEVAEFAIGQRVTVEREAGAVTLEIEHVVADNNDEGTWRILLSPLDGELAAGLRGARLDGLVEIVPRTGGVLVPPAAVGEDSRGQFVVSQSGRRIDVSVKASGDGVLVIDGVEAGSVLRITPALADGGDDPASSSVPTTVAER